MNSNEFTNAHEKCFDAFCKKVIRNAAYDLKRKKHRQKDKTVSISDIPEMVLDELNVVDEYVTYSKTYYVKDVIIVIEDERIGEAMKYIMPNKRAVLLLSYFKNYNDSQIARMLGITCKTVAYRKETALLKMKSLLEAMQDES